MHSFSAKLSCQSLPTGGLPWLSLWSILDNIPKSCPATIDRIGTFFSFRIDSAQTPKYMQVYSRTLAEVEMAGVRAVYNMATLRLRAYDTNDIR